MEYQVLLNDMDQVTMWLWAMFLITSLAFATLVFLVLKTPKQKVNGRKKIRPVQAHK